LRQEGTGLFGLLRNALHEHDPLQLGRGGDARDEYGSPVSTILPRLEDCSTPAQIRFVLEQEMTKHYPHTDLTKTDWSKLSSQADSIWSDFNRNRNSLR